MKLPLVVLLELSVAEQFTMVSPKGKVSPELWEQPALTLPSIASVAETVKVTAAPAAEVASSMILEGSESAGAILSTTVMVKLPVTVLLALSVAEQLTMVAPSWKVEPEAGLQATLIVPSTSSVALAVYVTDAPAALVALAVISAGRLRVGGPSCTVTVKLPLAELPAASVPEQFTVVVVFTGKVAPEAGLQLAVPGPLKPSVTVTEKGTTAPDGLVGPVTMFAGRLRVGAVLSIRMVTDCVVESPALLVAVQETTVLAVSVVKIVGAQPEKMPDCASVVVHDTVTLLMYQPFEPDVPDMFGVTTGGVVSVIGDVL